MRYLSLFSGIESATLAWHSLGWTPVAFSEIEPFCNDLLSHHYPDVPNLGDISTITEDTIQTLGSIDLIVFGSPCQDLSIAGKRSGLSGNRSGLFHRAIDIIDWAIKHNGLKYALWENVPGVFSSNQGNDFSEVLFHFTGVRHQLNQWEKKWRTSGIAFGWKSLCEWRVLDAQHFGVPQRRRRVFAFVDFTENERAQPVLFEPESLCGDPEKGREKEQDLAGTLEARTSAGGFPGTDGACANHIVVNPQPFDMEAFGQYGDGSKSSTLKQRDYKDATDLVVEPVPIHDQATRCTGKRADRQDGKGNGLGVGKPGDPMNTLTSGDKHAVCFQQNQRDELRLINGDGQIAGALVTNAGMKNKNYLAECYCGTQNDTCRDAGNEQSPTLRAGSNGGVVNPMIAASFKIGQGANARSIGYSEEQSPTLTSTDSGTQLAPGLLNHSIVRRLTPVECERLQGLPDNWTKIPYRNKPASQCPDTPRYRCIGNAMAVPAMHWIGRRIEKVCHGL